MAEIKSLLDNVIAEDIQNVKSLTSGSDERTAAIRELVQLHKLRIEEIKAQTDVDEKRERRKMDSEQRQAELNFKEQQVKIQEAQQQAELALKERQVDGDDADRKMRDEQNKAELALKEREVDGRDADRTREDAIQKQQVKEQKIDRYMRTSVQVGELILPLVCYGIWMNRGFKFEETGTFTSTTFKNLLNRFKPTKKG